MQIHPCAVKHLQWAIPSHVLASAFPLDYTYQITLLLQEPFHIGILPNVYVPPRASSWIPE